MSENNENINQPNNELSLECPEGAFGVIISNDTAGDLVGIAFAVEEDRDYDKFQELITKAIKKWKKCAKCKKKVSFDHFYSEAKNEFTDIKVSDLLNFWFFENPLKEYKIKTKIYCCNCKHFFR